MKRASPSPVVGVAGLGYMGLATGLAFSAKGWRVVGYDILPSTRRAVAQGRSPYSEVGLTELLRAQEKAGRFRVVDDM
jgi:UDP-N-acetyl-D-mannosaminuronate dehydrogenase